MDFGALCQQCGTDKGKYSSAYSGWLRPDRVSRILEMGIGGGFSIRLWLKYLPKAEVVVFDNQASAYRDVITLGNMQRVTAYTGNQTDLLFLEYLVRKHGPFDVIVDDAGHVPAEQLEAFTFLFERMNPRVMGVPRGMYIIEDIPDPVEKHWVSLVTHTKDIEHSLNTNEVIVRIRR